ncbi:carbonic anhydrase 1-like [Pollicipes pollicipes]|uniref:carbonic anhydrase 1-like n=1 Tax=Pollicipes pollicipes TaxID=41117 RepID=UPI001885027E|nr:carbonic anhydrase 1-like [Pollicipes pollicipes]XP_037073254.1 carbonic anhydrase 1-like [Pollicipes pollicipes]
MLPWWYAIIVLQFWPMDAPADLWDYDQPARWNYTFPLCDGPLQSPIALTHHRVVFSLPPKVVGAAGLAQGQVVATNTGRRLELRLRPANRSAPAIQLVSYKKPLFGVYNLEEVQFHWGDGKGTTGSEHSIGGKFFEAEAQFVFYNNFYGRIQKAKRQAGGVAVVSIMLRSSEKLVEPGFPTFGLENWLDQLSARDSRLTFPADLTPVQRLLSGALTKVYAYYGSFTSPPCNPVVTWLVSAAETDISARFLNGLVTKMFQDRAMTLPLVNNWRPLQLQTGRLVTKLQTIGGGVR